MNLIKKSEIAKLLPSRRSDSHKGENGRLLIIGGSIEFFGAPILSALAALNSGADLVHLLVPECNFDVSRTFYPDFIIRRYPGTHINSRTYDAALEILDKFDAILIGPGMGADAESVRVVARILQKARCPVVLDAEAIQAVAHLGLPTENETARFTITPHSGEISQFISSPLPQDVQSRCELMQELAQQWRMTILLKGQFDVISSCDKTTRVNETGNPGMTVGGTGDVLAGCVASLIAQHVDPYDACLTAAFAVGTAGDSAAKSKGFHFTASDVAHELPFTFKTLSS